MTYAVPSDVRLVTGLDTTEVSDVDLTLLISKATRRVNSQINFRVIREVILPLDSFRENDIDGTNTTFFVRSWRDWFIGDLDSDGDVDVSDLQVVEVAQDGTETTSTVSSVDPLAGSFILSVAPIATSALRVTYARAPLDESAPDDLITDAVAYLAGAFAIAKVNARKMDSFKIGKVTIKKSTGARDLLVLHNDAMHKINSKLTNLKKVAQLMPPDRTQTALGEPVEDRPPQ